MATKLTTVKHQSYTVSDKLRIIQFAEQHGNRAAKREFGVSESNVRLWRKSKENLEKMPRLKRANRGKKAAWLELEVDLLAWITEKRNNGLAILPSIVRSPRTSQEQEVQNSRRTFQSWQSLVSALHEEERSVTSTENSISTTSAR